MTNTFKNDMECVTSRSRSDTLVALTKLLSLLSIYYVLKPANCVPLQADQQAHKITGGHAAHPHEFPFQILILNETRGVHCGGSILSENFILTAAHCFHDYLYAGEYKSWTIVAGDHDWTKDEGTEQRRRIGEVAIHERYIPISLVNDLAIVKLSEPLNLSTREVQPIQLPSAAEDYGAGDEGVVTGWGQLRFEGNNPLVLQKVRVPIVDRETCRKAYEKEQVLVSPFMICAGDIVEGGVDACQGDSGGPLNVKLSNGSFTLIGVVSSGIGCGRAEYPGIYMRVSKYIDWINTTCSILEMLPEHNVSCDPNPCLNGGKCRIRRNKRHCECSSEFIGDNCEERNVCVYPGTCDYVVRGSGSTCKCRKGYVQEPQDSGRCEPLDASLIIPSSRGIEQFSLSPKAFTKLLNPTHKAKAVDFLYGTKSIFWGGESGIIYAAPFHHHRGATKTVVLNDSGSFITSLAVDWIYNHLYYADGERGRFIVTNLNGTMTKVLFNTGETTITAIVLDPLNGWIYWVDWNGKRIERCGMDGSQPGIILDAHPYNPYGLALDMTQNKIYCTIQDNPSSIWSINRDGTDRKLVFAASESTSPNAFIKSITTFGDNLYWRESSTKAVYRNNKCGGGKVTAIHSDTGSWDSESSLQAYHFSKQPHGHNYCENRIGGPCSHFCFRSPSTGNGTGIQFVNSVKTTCDCPNGFTLSPNKHTCRQISSSSSSPNPNSISWSQSHKRVSSQSNNGNGVFSSSHFSSTSWSDSITRIFGSDEAGPFGSIF